MTVKKRSERRRHRRRRYNANVGILLVTVVVLCFAAVMGIRMSTLRVTAQSYENQVAALQAELEAEEERESELAESKAYVQTREYIEKIARERLGLVGEDETVVKPNDD